MSKELGERLRELRTEKGLAQNELADAMGCNKANISYWETGKKNPTEFSIKMIAEFFDISTDYLLYGKD